MSAIRINNLDFRGSTCDGPGIRNIVFFQGCTKHCPGCHNPGTWDPAKGREMSIDDLADSIDRHTPLRRITISGGEPLLQLDGLRELVKTLRRREYDIAVYTGRCLREVPRDILDAIDYIKVGEYRQDCRTSIKPFVGSTNQEFIKLH